jgi:poly-gamma-glutamate capsule biosynthesis protein CapA/YwtB (metallophosphatase superfamily)
MDRRAALALATAALLLAGCDEAGTSDGPAAAPTRATTTTSAPPPDPAPTADPPTTSGEDDSLVVITHATRPQLRLTAQQASDLVARRGTAGVVRSVRAVERDPAAVGVVPLSAVGPTVVAATVAGVDPVRDRTGATTLVVTGDVMLVRDVPDPADALAPMRRLLRGADLTVGNLESTLSTDGEPQQPNNDSFGGSPALVPVLEDAGYDALSLANNHTGDYGERALRQTAETLQQSRIQPFGAGDDLAEAAEPAVLSAPDGTTYAFLGFNAIGETPQATAASPGALSVRMPPRTGPLVEADVVRVERAVRRAGRLADVVVVIPHWGEQYTHTPWPDQRTVARRLVTAGADLVVGGHPHWVQGADAVDGVPVLHSLGNFVFDMDFMTQTMEGVVLEATFWGAELKAIRLLPYRMDPGSFAPRRVVGQDVLADVWSASSGPFAPRSRASG